MADDDTIATMVAAVEAADALADLVVVTIHWGVELQAAPPAGDVRRAEAMIDAGADMIFGHHPHRLNALEFHLDVTIVSDGHPELDDPSVRTCQGRPDL